jgi:hypothetical protein
MIPPKPGVLGATLHHPAGTCFSHEPIGTEAAHE